jgi:Domain of unknown function (DUF4395)
VRRLQCHLHHQQRTEVATCARNVQAAVGVIERFAHTEPRFCTGAPKQFANFVGVIFGGLATLFLFLALEHGAEFKWIGFFFTVGLVGATALNGFINYCLGAQLHTSWHELHRLWQRLIMLAHSVQRMRSQMLCAAPPRIRRSSSATARPPVLTAMQRNHQLRAL